MRRRPLVRRRSSITSALRSAKRFLSAASFHLYYRRDRAFRRPSHRGHLHTYPRTPSFRAVSGKGAAASPQLSVQAALEYVTLLIAYPGDPAAVLYRVPQSQQVGHTSFRPCRLRRERRRSLKKDALGMLIILAGPVAYRLPLLQCGHSPVALDPQRLRHLRTWHLCLPPLPALGDLGRTTPVG